MQLYAIPFEPFICACNALLILICAQKCNLLLWISVLRYDLVLNSGRSGRLHWRIVFKWCYIMTISSRLPRRYDSTGIPSLALSTFCFSPIVTYHCSEQSLSSSWFLCHGLRRRASWYFTRTWILYWHPIQHRGWCRFLHLLCQISFWPFQLSSNTNLPFILFSLRAVHRRRWGMKILAMCRFNHWIWHPPICTVILIVRTYALYGKSRKVLVCLLVNVGLAIAVASVSGCPQWVGSLLTSASREVVHYWKVRQARSCTGLTFQSWLQSSINSSRVSTLSL